ncbi:MAG: hypothetical protein ACWGOX_04025 [Desulforhopalus sp.]
MKIDILTAPDADIMRDRKRYAVFFTCFLVLACLGLGIGAYAIYFNAHHYDNLENIALVCFVGASLFISYFGGKLQAYKRLYPPHKEKLAELREHHPVIDTYCRQVEALKRPMIKAEFEACVTYAEKHQAIPFQ